MVKRQLKQWFVDRLQGDPQPSMTSMSGKDAADGISSKGHSSVPASGESPEQRRKTVNLATNLATNAADNVTGKIGTSEAIPDDRPVPTQPEQPVSSLSRFKQWRSWRWTLLCLAVLGMISGMGAAALLWLVSLPPPPQCKEPATLTLDIERLYCAQEAVQAGGLPELITGLELLKQWSPEDSLYAETQNLAEEWSKQVLAIARDKVSQNDLNGALEAIRHIPNTTPVYQEAQELVAYWQKQWQEGAAIDAKAQEALKQQNWTLASELVAVLANFANSYWNTQRANALAQQIGAEKQARQVLARARDAAQGGQPEQFGQAIMIAQAIPQNTYTWQDGRQDLRKWSQTLLAIGSQRWDAGDWAGAVAALQKVPRSTTVPELQDLVRFSTVYTLLHHNVLSQQPSHTWIPSMQQVWSLMEAVAAISQVPSDSPFYQKAQDLEKNLRLQLADLSQLYYAAFWAGLGQKSTLDLAIDQARQILPDRPRRIQAQTLIAHWYDEIERIEDQPYLDRANALAASGEIPDLQAAIAEASLVPQGRALRRTAQGLIAAWRDQIETIEDQPTLDQAWGLANAGNLGEAIDTAQRIRPGRALYNQAQSAIDTWQAQLIRAQQLAVDQPILDRAKALANSGNLYDAIQVAAQIEAGRVLYGEAQGLINTWKAQLNPPRPDPNAVEPDKPDSKPDTLPDWWNEAPERPTDIFIWPDGSLSPYSPPGSDSPDSSTPGSPMPPAVTPSLTPPGSSPANRQPPASAPPSLPSRTAPEPPPSVLPAPAPSSLIESPPAIEAAPPPLPDRSPPDSSHQDSSTRSQNHSSNL